LSSYLSSQHSLCPYTKFALAGYSQGAQVAGDVYQSVNPGVRSQIVALALLGDPRFNPKQPSVDYGNFDSRQSGVWPLLKLGGTERTVNTSQSPANVRSYCLKFDPVCNFSVSNAINCAGTLYCVHLHYIDFGYTADAANWIAPKL
jgi:Cutinase